MPSENIKQDNLQSLIDDLNYATLIEDRWSIEFIDSNGVRKLWGMAYARIKDGIWVTHLDRDKGEFPRIRAELEKKNFECVDKLGGFSMLFVEKEYFFELFIHFFPEEKIFSYTQ